MVAAVVFRRHIAARSNDVDSFEKLLRKKLGEVEEVRVKTLTQTGLTSFEEYKTQFGYLTAIRDILSLCDQVNSELRKDR